MSENEYQKAYNDILQSALASVPKHQIIDAGGLGPSFELFLKAKQMIPTSARSSECPFSILSGPALSDWLEETLVYRRKHSKSNSHPMKIGGCALNTVHIWPEDIKYKDTEVTHILLCQKDNILIGEEGSIKRPEDIVLIKNVDIYGSPYVGCILVYHTT